MSSSDQLPTRRPGKALDDAVSCGQVTPEPVVPVDTCPDVPHRVETLRRGLRAMTNRWSSRRGGPAQGHGSTPQQG